MIAAAFHALSSILLAIILENAVDVGVVPGGWSWGARAVQGIGLFGGVWGTLSRHRFACNVIN